MWKIAKGKRWVISLNSKRCHHVEKKSDLTSLFLFCLFWRDCNFSLMYRCNRHGCSRTIGLQYYFRFVKYLNARATVYAVGSFCLKTPTHMCGIHIDVPTHVGGERGIGITRVHCKITILEICFTRTTWSLYDYNNFYPSVPAWKMKSRGRQDKKQLPTPQHAGNDRPLTILSRLSWSSSERRAVINLLGNHPVISRYSRTDSGNIH